MNHLEEAATCLRGGGLVALPTETVYGLGANIFIDEAVRGIFKAKGRPSDNPLIVHIARRDQVDELVSHIPAEAEKLMSQFWPGPISFVFHKSDKVSALVSGGLDTVAVRIPSHPAALKLLDLANVPVAAPSANSSGKPSPVDAEHVLSDLEGRIDFVVDGGRCDVGIESTVLDCTSYPFTVLRPGSVTVEMLSKVCAVTVRTKTGEVARSPGMKYRHYTPEAKVYLVTGEPGDAANRFAGQKVAYIGMRPFSGELRYIAESIEDFSRNIFAMFRAFDRAGADIILVDAVEESGIGMALMNRLRKAGEFLD
ncbi:L-threonylcarbamoyladenylate synthase [Verrucomicrobiota bacterium]